MLLALLACSSPPSTGGPPVADEPGLFDTALDAATQDDIPVSTALSLDVRSNPNNVLIPLVELSGGDAYLVEFWSDDVSPRRTDLGEGLSPVRGLRAETTYSMRALVPTGDGYTASPVVEWTTAALPWEVPDYELVTPMADDGTIVLIGPASTDHSVTSDPYLFGVDRGGHVVWYLDPPIEAHERFVKFGEDGTTWVASVSEILQYAPDGELINRIASPGRLHHDIEPLGNGNVLALLTEETVMDVDGVGQDIEVHGDEVVELSPQGTVVWSWSSFDHIEVEVIDDLVNRNLETLGILDYTHANSLEVSDGEVVLSLRHLNAAVGIDRATGEVAWRVDEWSPYFGDATSFRGQHTVERDGQDLWLFDNMGDGKSRAVQYAVLPDGAVEPAWEWSLGARYDTHGSVRRLGDDHLVCAGGSRVEGQPARIAQVDWDGDVVWEIQGFDGHLVYRAEPVRWATVVE